MAKVDGKEANAFKVTDELAAYKSYFEDEDTKALTFKVEPISTDASISAAPVLKAYTVDLSADISKDAMNLDNDEIE